MLFLLLYRILLVRVADKDLADHKVALDVDRIRLQEAVVAEPKLVYQRGVHVDQVAVVGALKTHSERAARVKVRMPDVDSLLLCPVPIQPTVAAEDVLAIARGIEPWIEVEVNQRVWPDLATALQVDVEGIGQQLQTPVDVELVARVERQLQLAIVRHWEQISLVLRQHLVGIVHVEDLLYFTCRFRVLGDETLFTGDIGHMPLYLQRIYQVKGQSVAVLTKVTAVHRD